MLSSNCHTKKDGVLQKPALTPLIMYFLWTVNVLKVHMNLYKM